MQFTGVKKLLTFFNIGSKFLNLEMREKLSPYKKSLILIENLINRSISL
jgi:hypothetical protein